MILCISTKQDGNTFPILDHEIKRKKFSLMAPVVAKNSMTEYDGGLTAYDSGVMI